MPEQGRWAGRNPGKDVIRNEVWRTLEATGTAVGPAWSMIPNFVGADMAAWHLAQTPEWQRAKTVKTNPDAPQIPIRLRALYEGKIGLCAGALSDAGLPLSPHRSRRR